MTACAQRAGRASRRSRRARLATNALTGLVSTALVLTACGTPAEPHDNSGKVRIVTSTNVWASIARSVGGPDVEVTPLVTNSDADPHSYESTPRDAAKISDADLVLENGGGYDEFMSQVLSASGSAARTVRAVPDTGHEHNHGPVGHDKDEHDADNEHVWYDPDRVADTAAAIADQLGDLRPHRAEQFEQRAQRFTHQLNELDGRIDELATQHRGAPIIATEPIAQHLVRKAGLQDITPDEFVNAVEAETDPPATAVAAITDAVHARSANAVLYNPQTESAVTRDVREQAARSGIPVVRMTETLPHGTDGYLSWMRGQIDQLDRALRG